MRRRSPLAPTRARYSIHQRNHRHRPDDPFFAPVAHTSATFRLCRRSWSRWTSAEDGGMECRSNGVMGPAKKTHYSGTPLLHYSVGLPNRRLRLSFLHYRRAHRFAFFDETNLAMLREAGAGRNQVTHDHVFLEPAETIDLAERCCFGQDARCILEGRRRDEAVGFERRDRK